MFYRQWIIEQIPGIHTVVVGWQIKKVNMDGGGGTEYEAKPLFATELR